MKKKDYKFSLKFLNPINKFLFYIYTKGVHFACKNIKIDELKVLGPYGLF